MALLGNASLLHKSPAKYVTGVVGFCDRANSNKPGMMRNRGDLTLSTLWKYDAVPSGTYAGRAFLPPQKAGRLVTRSAFGVSAQASGAMGLPGAASASISLDASAIGGLFAGGVAHATMTVSASGAIAGLAAGSANGSISINASAITGASAWGVAACTMNLSASAQGYGLGHMQASTVDNSVLSPNTITAAVWSALDANFNAPGTMGYKLNMASAGGVDINALAAAVLATLQANTIPANVVQIKGQAINGAGSEADPWGPTT